MASVSVDTGKGSAGESGLSSVCVCVCVSAKDQEHRGNMTSDPDVKQHAFPVQSGAIYILLKCLLLES